jgi:hypothetical protein
MLATNPNQTFAHLFLRHDLMIELGRLERAIDETRQAASATDARRATSLELKYAQVSAALDLLDS